MLQFSDLTIEAAVANRSEAMEADTISKNGRSLKSQMSRINGKLFALFILSASTFVFSSCSSSSPEKDGIKAAQKMCDCGKDIYVKAEKVTELYIKNFNKTGGKYLV